MEQMPDFAICKDCGERFRSELARNNHGREAHPTLYRRSGLLSDEEACAIRERMPFGPPYAEFAGFVADDWNINVQTVLNIAIGSSYARPKACPPGHPLRLAINAKNAADQKVRDKVKRAMRKEIGERQEWRCVYCQRDISKSSSIDHIEPIERGGPSEMDNLQLTCRRCNSSKGTLSDAQFRVKIGQIKIALARREEFAKRYGWSSYEACQQAGDCPCHHYGCPPGCPGCEMCNHTPGLPDVVICPGGEFGLEECTDLVCRQSCKLDALQ